MGPRPVPKCGSEIRVETEPVCLKPLFPGKTQVNPVQKPKIKQDFAIFSLFAVQGGNRTDPPIGNATSPHLHSWLLACLLALSSCCVNRPGDPSPMQLCPSPYIQPPLTILQENRPPSPQPWPCHSCNGYPLQKRKQGLGQTNRHLSGPTTSWTFLLLNILTAPPKCSALPYATHPGSFSSLGSLAPCWLRLPSPLHPWQSHVPQHHHRYRYMMHAYMHTCKHNTLHTWHDMTWHDITLHYAYIHTYIHTYLHTYIHTYLHTYIHTCIDR